MNCMLYNQANCRCTRLVRFWLWQKLHFDVLTKTWCYWNLEAKHTINPNMQLKSRLISKLFVRIEWWQKGRLWLVYASWKENVQEVTLIDIAECLLGSAPIIIPFRSIKKKDGEKYHVEVRQKLHKKKEAVKL